MEATATKIAMAPAIESPASPASALQVDENRQDEDQRKDVLDRLETAQDLAEDVSGQIARRDLAEEDGRRQHDHERAADPEGQRESDRHAREVQGPASLTRRPGGFLLLDRVRTAARPPGSPRCFSPRSPRRMRSMPPRPCSLSPPRRSSARTPSRRTPVGGEAQDGSPRGARSSAALGLADLPWWPGLRAAALRLPAATAESSLSGAGRVLGFFAFAPSGDHPLGAAGWLRWWP